MRLYDLVIVTKPSLTDAQRKKFLDSVKDFLKGMNVVKDEDLGQKPLAYKIKHEIAGVYHRLQLETDNSVTPGIEKRLINDENVLRHLLIRTK